MTIGDGVTPEVREFLRQRIWTYEQLEIVLLLRDDPERGWSSQALAEHLHIPVPAVAEALDHLRRAGLVDASFRYAPSPEVASTLDLLAVSYESQRLAVMNVMNSNAIARVRNEALHLFADAFVVIGSNTKDKDEGKDG